MTTILACGDINIQQRDDPTVAVSPMKAVFEAADFRLGNLEMCLAGSDVVLKEKLGWTQSDPEMVTALEYLRFDAFTTGNNVTYPRPAILRSLAVLDEKGFGHTGSGATLADARRPVIIERDGVRVGMLGYTCIFFPLDHAAEEDQPGVAVIRCHTAYEPNRRAAEMPAAPPTVRSWPSPESLADLKQDIDRLRDQVDVLICYFHMGMSSQEDLTEYQRHLSHAAVDYGADLVLGASAHRPQAVEIYQDHPIFYGLGNFAFDWWKVRIRKTGLLARFTVDGGRLRRAAFVPVCRTDDDANQVHVAELDSPQGRAIVDRVAELSAEFGTTFTAGDGEVIVWER